MDNAALPKTNEELDSESHITELIDQAMVDIIPFTVVINSLLSHVCKQDNVNESSIREVYIYFQDMSAFDTFIKSVAAMIPYWNENTVKEDEDIDTDVLMSNINVPDGTDILIGTEYALAPHFDIECENNTIAVYICVNIDNKDHVSHVFNIKEIA